MEKFHDSNVRGNINLLNKNKFQVNRIGHGFGYLCKNKLDDIRKKLKSIKFEICPVSYVILYDLTLDKEFYQEY
jgi:hypothetical protein